MPHFVFSKQNKGFKTSKSPSAQDQCSASNVDTMSRLPSWNTRPKLRNRRSSSALPETRPEEGDGLAAVPSPTESPEKAKNNDGVQSGTHSNNERLLHSVQLDRRNGSPDQSPKMIPDTSEADGPQNFDLKPPPPNAKEKQIDVLSELLFSAEHMQAILKDFSLFHLFKTFLERYRPHQLHTLGEYLEAQKALKAIEYANAIARGLNSLPTHKRHTCEAASIDPTFETRAQQAFTTLVSEALPPFITSALTTVVTEFMVKEITGTSTPLSRELVGGLAEVFCLADPSLDDCPIVYASEEFYRTTQYSRDDVIGRNCRFLQGTRTNRATVAGLAAKIKAGQEACEVILNYRRDGSPFMNLLLLAPLFDNKGVVRYHIGAQVDVSGLLEEGRGLDSFEQLLHERASNQRTNHYTVTNGNVQNPNHLLSELSQLLSQDESTSLAGSHSRDSSVNDSSSALGRREPTPRRPRRVLGAGEEDKAAEEAWPHPSSAIVGRLPGVYKNYLLVRPYPSLRIIFVSPSLRIPGLLQSGFLSHIEGPEHVRDGLAEALEQGTTVTAKVSWISQTDKGDHHRKGSNGAHEHLQMNGNSNNRAQNSNGRRTPRALEAESMSSPFKGPELARTRYVSCTPLLGSDDQVGVWMVVMVENEAVTGLLNARMQSRHVRAERSTYAENYGNGLRHNAPHQNTETTFSGHNQSVPSGLGNSFANGRGPEAMYSPTKSTQRDTFREANGDVASDELRDSEGGMLYTRFMGRGAQFDGGAEDAPGEEEGGNLASSLC